MIKSKRDNDLERQSRDNARRHRRRKNRSAFFLQKEKEAAEALADAETIVLEIEIKIPRTVTAVARHKAYGLVDEEGNPSDEAHDVTMEFLVNQVNGKPLRDFEITGWGFKEKDNDGVS